jgi:N-acetylglucosamine-6-phosphate deacetylase
MRPIRITNGSVITPGAVLKDADVLIRGTRIAAVGRAPASGEDCLEVDAGGAFVAPGFIDTHIHGAPGRVLANGVKSGTTAVVLALSCDSPGRVSSKIDEIRAFIAEDPLGRAVLGARLEGPYINKRRAGAQDKRHIKRPDKKGLLGILKGARPLLRIITIAPEIKGARPLLSLLKKSGVIASIGHTDATYEEAMAGFDSGIAHATHLFNAMSGLDGGERGAATAALLDERVYAEAILDLVHFHPKLFRLLAKVKDAGKIILVTDSIRAECEGCRRRGGRLKRPRVERRGGVYRFPDGRIAGSALTMAQAVKNAVRAGGLSVIDAVRCATLNPARLLGIENKKGSIAAGKDADIVLFDKCFNVKMTLIRGRIVYAERKRGIRCAE